MTGEDKDLAAHFTIINHRGKCLYGASIKDIFADVPVQDYIDSIWNDIAEAKEEITDNPMYLILNLSKDYAKYMVGEILFLFPCSFFNSEIYEASDCCAGCVQD